MDLFDWTTLQVPTQTLEGLELLARDFNGHGETSYWNDYYDNTLNVVDAPEGAYLSYESPFGHGHTATSSVHGPQSDSYIAQDDFRRRSAATSTSTQSYPSSGERDPVANRIQRRRTQNRNSQRIYRQRRVDERKKFEDRAIAAEEKSEMISCELKELQAEVLDLRDQVEHLEAENLALRSSISSMPRKRPQP